jgi:hypothetical protein
MIQAGTYKARAAQFQLGAAPNGSERAEVVFEITEGEHEGQTIRWDGYFSEKTAKRTIESLQHCGWTGDDLSAIRVEDMPNEVEIVVELEAGQGDYAGKEFPKVRWVNRLGGGRLNVQNALDPARARAFGERMKGLVAATRGDKGQAAPPKEKLTGGSFPFGANSPAAGRGKLSI